MGSIKLNVFGVLFFGLMLLGAGKSTAQSAEVKQLALNVEKLTQLKSILSDMKKGFQVLSSGYGAVKNIAEGNFSLHETFLDGLMLVSPAVKKYHKVAGIIRYQGDILSEYRRAFNQFSSSDVFSVSDIDYLEKVYGKLNKESLANLDRLLMVVTSSKLRMSDEERLSAIDRIYDDMSDKLVFLRSFNREAGLLQLQRKRERAEVKATGNYFSIP